MRAAGLVALRFGFFFCAAALVAGPAAATCPPQGGTLATLHVDKASDWKEPEAR